MTKIKKLSFIFIIMLVLLFPIVFCACGQNTNTKSGEWETLTNVQKIEIVYGTGDYNKLEYNYIKNVRINRQEQRIVFTYSESPYWQASSITVDGKEKIYYKQIEAPLQSTIIHFRDFETAKDLDYMK